MSVIFTAVGALIVVMVLVYGGSQLIKNVKLKGEDNDS